MIAYLDCSSGMSGDMMLGAVVDAGVCCEKLKEELSHLPVQGYDIACKKVLKSGISATKVTVTVHDTRTSRKWKDVKNLIEESTFSDDIKSKGLHVFKRLFEAEARVHGSTYDRVHLHELGALDCLVDIFGSLSGLKALNIEKLYASAINLGSGTVKTSHGIVPVPAPATAELLKGASVYSDTTLMELTTPTGAGILSTLVQEFVPLPPMEIQCIGYGAGERDIPQKPNVVRLIVGQTVHKGFLHDKVTIIETNIDDMNPQLFEHTMNMLFEAGALDVFLTPIIMKKSRPATILTAIVKKQYAEKISDIILRETTTFGVRMYENDRYILDRKTEHIETPYGKVAVKIGAKGTTVYKKSFEYEDLKKLSQKSGLSLNALFDEARITLFNLKKSGED
jgi:uncharacterized protein (TIGR00299 family) protein